VDNQKRGASWDGLQIVGIRTLIRQGCVRRRINQKENQKEKEDESERETERETERERERGRIRKRKRARERICNSHYLIGQ
jgi:hypothetical protein